MAFGAFAFACPRLELSLVRVGRVTVHALGEGQFLFEVAARMALIAPYFRVHAQQWIFRLRVIKLLLRHVHFFPAAGRVAGLARCLELALVRIRMAGRAGVKPDAGVFHGFVRPGREMAFLAGHPGMRASQGILCFRMVELLCLFPVGDIVALLAVWAELPLVYVLMAGYAVL